MKCEVKMVGYWLSLCVYELIAPNLDHTKLENKDLLTGFTVSLILSILGGQVAGNPKHPRYSGNPT